MWYTQGEHRARTRRGLRAHWRSPTPPANRKWLRRLSNLLGHVEYAVGNMNAARDRFTHSVDAFRRLWRSRGASAIR